MKGVLISIILIGAFKFFGAAGQSDGCEPDWSDKCTSDTDCCSRFCGKDPSAKSGVCKPICGRPASNFDEPTDSNGKIEIGAFPWHAGIYQKDSFDSFNQICGGTLISRKVVVSAAHCFEEPNRKINQSITVKPPSTIKVALGKYNRALNAPEDNLAEIIDVERIEIHPDYNGFKSSFTNDIAFVTLKTEVKYTKVVLPICIDLSKEDDSGLKGLMGKVVGWGKETQKGGSETLTLADMPFLPVEECKSRIDKKLVSYVKGDKICAGDKTSDAIVCRGDGGGGLVFEDPTTKAYYLRGVVSLGPTGCKPGQIILFTALSAHKELVEKYLELS